ncbi:hypothetical protein H310_02634 [Aphanomyces invadans]|uniref:Tc1-like transposase DDE domain-containing protein n=1 Tax=Aphanomyces invadans TaxID=157072 RepID=A0A024UJ83_9STRA|nr:hypothetical protein H310_02634 [Aphanomyces invadans]ETW06354.1 hypothetical protein H310_02634 [Aphanomyces invadans]|eukprot:XP_008864429.1 hypothetical protein H310_02634 [Aphanomyces invadans]
MLLVAVARPRSGLDGEVGCWPLDETIPAECTSKNRPAGTPVLSTVAVPKPVYRDLLLNQLLPAIKRQWVRANGDVNGTIYVQQDNARPHISVDDAEFVQAAAYGGWKIQLMCQPPQSPDLNVLDLGFFNSIQALQQQMECRSIEELVCAVDESFKALPHATLEKTFQTWKRIMRVVASIKGDNKYKMPRSVSTEDDVIALEMMNLRLEEEDRMNEIADLVSILTV